MTSPLDGNVFPSKRFFSSGSNGDSIRRLSSSLMYHDWKFSQKSLSSSAPKSSFSSTSRLWM